MGVFELEIIRSLLNLENQIASPWRHKRIALLWDLLCMSSSRGWTLQGIHPGSSTWPFYIPVSALTTVNSERLGAIEGLRELASEECHRCGWEKSRRCGLQRSSGWALGLSTQQDWDPRKSGCLTSPGRKWAFPVKRGQQLLQMQFFWHTKTGSYLFSLNLKVNVSLRIMASDRHISTSHHSPEIRKHVFIRMNVHRCFWLHCHVKNVTELLFLVLGYS